MRDGEGDHDQNLGEVLGGYVKLPGTFEGVSGEDS